MRGPKPLCASRASGRGYTLVEILAVMLIVGICAGIVTVLSQPGPHDRLRIEADRLAQLLQLAATEARLTGRAVAWTSDGAHYRFWRWQREAGWSAIPETDVLRPRSLPPGMLVASLEVEAMRRASGMRLEFSPYRPDFSYSIGLSQGPDRYSITASPMGAVRAVSSSEAGHATVARP